MKRVLYIIGVLAVSVLLVGTMLLAALTSDRVETAAVQLATAELSRGLGTKARVGAVEYRFPSRLTIRDIYIEDQQRDTLLYLSEVYAQFRPMLLRKGQIVFSHVGAKDGVAKVYRVDSTWNYQFLADAFRTEKKEDDAPLQSLIAVRDIRLDNLRLQYEDYVLQLHHSQADLHHLTDDSIDAQISRLAMEAHRLHPAFPGQAFEVEELQAHVVLNDTALLVPTLTARLPRSRMDLSGIEVHFPEGDTLYLSKSAHDITFSLAFREASIVPADLALFAPRVKGLTRAVTLHGAVGGTLDSLYFDHIAVRYNNHPLLEGNVSAVGLPDLTNPYLRANLTDLSTNAARLQDFLSQLYGRPTRLPQEIHRLGTVHYRGLAEGHLHDLTLHGAFRTALGTISTDGFFRSDSLFEHMHYDARIVGRKFRLGRLVNHTPLGTATLDFASKGQIVDKRVSGTVRARVRELTYNNYTYQDLVMDGRYEPQLYAGTVRIDDPHMSASFDGVVNLQDINPEMNFNLLCRHFDSSPLQLSNTGNFLQTRFSLAVDINGSKIDEMSGYMVLDSLYLATRRDSMLMQQMTLLLTADNDRNKAITLQSDFLTTQIDGSFRYTDIVPAAQAMLHHYLPTAVEAPKQGWLPVSFTMRTDGKRLRDVQRLFVAPITLSDHPVIRADADLRDGKEPQFNFRFFAPGIRAGNTPVHDLTVTLNTIDTLRHEGASGSGLALSVSAEAMQMHTVFSTLAFQDTLLTHLTLRQASQLHELLPDGWQDLSPRELQRALNNTDLTHRERYQALLSAQRAGDYGGDIRLITHFSQYNRKPLIDLHFLPGTLTLRDSLYTLGESRITYCAADTSVQVEHFQFEGGGQHLLANGLASPRRTDTIEVDLQKVNAAYVVPFLLPVQTIMFDGLLTGQAQIISAFRRPTVETQIHIDSMGLNSCYFGEAEVELMVKDSLYFHADVYRPDRKLVNLNGKALFDGTGRWELDMQTDSVPLAFVNHWTASVLRDLDGHGTGRVVVGGRKNFTYVLLDEVADNASLTLPWTGARYTIRRDTIRMDTTAILFPNVHLVDAEGNPLEINGSIHHDQFHDFELDLHVDAHDALVFDNNKSGEMMQGHVFANGHVDVTGPEDDILVKAEAVTSGKSSFRLSIDNAASAYESTFIHFVEHPEDKQKSEVIETDLDNIDIQTRTQSDTTLWKRAGRCLLTLNLEVNPLLQFQLVLGERNGDIIQARGNGALRLTYDTETGDVKLLGTYDIDRGTMSYTVANVIRKEFTIGEGATISFSGDPSNPQLDVTAKYRVTANLKDLFGEDIDQLATTRTNIPVLTCIHMTGPLNNPILNFSLEFPTSDQAIQQQVRQVINTDEMMMRQVIYLLVFGRFFTPDNMTQTQSSTLNSTYSLLSSTVTSQINAWLSKLTNIFTMGVAIRTDGEGASASQEYEAQFQLQPVDRLIINGNVGYRYNDISNQPFFGDLDVEFLLTEDGQWRLKGYTHTVDKYSLREASTIQGVGFQWKKDFNWPSRKKKVKSE